MIKTLAWDSEFFGFPVGQVKLDAKPNWEEIIPVIKQNTSKFNLVYLITDEKIIVPDHILITFNGRFVNQKVLYSKRLRETKYNIPDYISEYKATDLNQDFIELAHLSGYYSRFKIDSNFPKGKFKELYETWIRKSLERTIADRIFVANHDGRISAMVTYKNDNFLCKIGLVAVCENEQGKGTGRFLIQLSEQQAYDQGLKKINVATQSNNFIACKFYKKMGFSPVEITNYYHLWVK